MVDYNTFQVLLDEPSDDPRLGFDVYATSFAEIIVESRARFAVGIFGEWGSGKTTLMQAIERSLADRNDVVTVWFNAWRYENEPHLIVPLLDTLREALAVWDRPGTGDAPSKAKRAAGVVGRAARALLAGFSAKAGFLGVGFDLSGKDILEELKEPPDDAADDPQSFYHAGFNAMQDAVAAFAYDDPANRTRVDRRIVIFIDDLDRCLPANALQVLESMKVMFDLPGFVFVAGLAQSVIDQAVALKYKDLAKEEDVGVRGPNYSKKLFQVPFALPSIQTTQLPDYFQGLANIPALGIGQAEDLRKHVQPHLTYLSEDGVVNPREIKRFINAYTLQIKMLARKLGPDDVKPNVVLSLQAMNFRSDWQGIYDLLAADPEQFRDELRQRLEDPDPGGLWIGAEKQPLPVSFLGYVEPGQPGADLLGTGDLGPYVTSAEFTRSTDPAIAESQAALRDLRRAVGGITTKPELDSEDVNEYGKALDKLTQRPLSGTGPLSQGLDQRLNELRELSSNLGPDQWEDRRDTWAIAVAAPLAEVGQALAELRRRSNVGTAS